MCASNQRKAHPVAFGGLAPSISTLGDRFLEHPSVGATNRKYLVPEVHLFRFKSGDECGVDGLAPVDP